MSTTRLLVSTVLLCAIVAMALVVVGSYQTQTKRTSSPATHQHQSTVTPLTLFRTSVVSSPQLRTVPTNIALPSYVESRSVQWNNTDHDVTICPYAQHNNHKPFSTQATHVGTEARRQHTPATTQPRVNLWCDRLCGIFV